MTSNNWNVEEYKTEHECDEHWELRRSFLLAHKGKFPEDRLICLAQVFTNVEFLGCRYPAKTMSLVASLSKGVADKYREKQKGRLQRTFVQASDAAGAKAKGLKRPLQDEGSSSSSDIKKSTVTDSAADESLKASSELITVESALNSYTTNKPVTSSKTAQITLGPSILSPQTSNSNVQPSNSANTASSEGGSLQYGGVRTYHIDHQSLPLQADTVNPFAGAPYGRLVLVEPAYEVFAPMQVIQNSAKICMIQCETRYELSANSQIICHVYLNGELLSSGYEFSRKAASRKAAEEGLKKLRQTCFTIKTKQKFIADGTIDKSLDVTPTFDPSSGATNAAQEGTGVGDRLLRLMGWSGGGLGKDQQGIQEPVRVQEHIHRSGLGLSLSSGTDFRTFRDKVYRLMEDFVQGDSRYDLVFSSDFTNDERKTMHMIANKLRLKTRSYGRDAERYLVVSKKKDIWGTVEELLKSGSTERYDLYRPGELII